MLLTYSSVAFFCLFQDVKAQWDKPSFPAMDCKMKNLNGDAGMSDTKSIISSSFASHNNANFKFFVSKHPLFLLFFWSYKRRLHSANFTKSVWLLGPVSRVKRHCLLMLRFYSFGIQVQELIFTPSLPFVDLSFLFFRLNKDGWYHYRKIFVSMTPQNQL